MTSVLLKKDLYAITNCDSFTNESIEDKGLTLFLDFYKAFDAVEHPFIMKELEYFRFR